MVKKKKQQIDDEKDKPKISGTVLSMLKAEAYYLTKLPELETKYGMLGGKD